jgi:hypothetical protein
MEPTPGRGAPGAEAWTGVPEQQDGSGPVSTVTTQVAPPTSVEVGPDATAPATTVDRAPEGQVVATDEETGSAPLGTGATRVVVAILGFALLWAVAVPLALLARRAVRLRRASTSGARVLLLWGEAQRSLASIGAIRHPSETHQEYALRARHVAGGPDDVIVELAELADLADYAGQSSGDAVSRAHGAEHRIRGHVAHRLPYHRRLTRWLDPRPLIPRPGRAIDTHLANDESRSL